MTADQLFDIAVRADEAGFFADCWRAYMVDCRGEITASTIGYHERMARYRDRVASRLAELVDGVPEITRKDAVSLLFGRRRRWPGEPNDQD